MSAVLPGATIGILGGGQLGRMMTLAARTLGFHVIVLDPDPRCAASAVADRVIAARFDDAAAAAELARSSDVVTIEIEKIAVASLEAAAAVAPVRPGAHVLHVVQDRARQKHWLAGHGFPVGPWWMADSAESLGRGIAAAGRDAFVKACAGGYDGRSQARASDPSEGAELWRMLGAAPCVVERALTLEMELSVLVARRPGGRPLTYAPSWNQHANGVLDWAAIPAPVTEAVAARATALASAIAESLDVVGLLVAELFLLDGGDLVVNELAPRPHNSYHHTELSALTSQFEQAVRAVCDLPLGAPDILRPAAIANLFGDLWLDGRPPRWAAALEEPGVRVHLYGKAPRPGRKMGHLGAVGATSAEAAARVRAARDRLGAAIPSSMGVP